MNESAPQIKIDVDPTNPGQFFACCGLLELADRLTGKAQGWFDQKHQHFFIRTCKASTSLEEIIQPVLNGGVRSSVGEENLKHLRKLLNKSKNSLTKEEKQRKQELKILWDRERIEFNKVPKLVLNWWNDNLAGGSKLKTWAGKQLLIDIVRGLIRSLNGILDNSKNLQLDQLLSLANTCQTPPFYFSSNFGSHSSNIDVGFSLDAINKNASTRLVILVTPATEFFSFIGLQRFRPAVQKGNFSFKIWNKPLTPLLAAASIHEPIVQSVSEEYKFRLMYRSKYLKAFLTATLQPV